MPDFNATNRPGTCPWCGRKLTTWKASDGKVWPHGYPPFDTMRCGLAFGRAAHRQGFRFKPKGGRPNA